MSGANLNEILNSHTTEAYTRSEIETFAKNHFITLKKYGCDVQWEQKIIDEVQTNSPGKHLKECSEKGYLIIQLPQLGVRFLHVKVFGGKGLFGKKIHYAVYQQDFDENKWTPVGNFKSWAQTVTALNNIFRHEGLLKGSAL